MEKIEKLAQWMKDSELTIIFTGAGISTESGLPDYRSSTGIWTKEQLEKATTDELNKSFEQFIDFYRDRVISLQQYKPNIAHKILSKWQNTNIIGAIITQNVDGFHQMAGTRNVIELHGTLTKQRCLGCRKEYDTNNDRDEKCIKCRGKLRPCVVLYGESLPIMAYEKAVLEASRSQLFISIGSSLQVSPANLLPIKAKLHGSKFCIINNEKTDLDGQADLVINDNISKVLSALDNIIG